MHDYELSEPFEITKDGTFTVPVDGQLYLRCRDNWGSLSDNSGKLTVRLKLPEKDKTAAK